MGARELYREHVRLLWSSTLGFIEGYYIHWFHQQMVQIHPDHRAQICEVRQTVSSKIFDRFSPTLSIICTGWRPIIAWIYKGVAPYVSAMWSVRVWLTFFRNHLIRNKIIRRNVFCNFPGFRVVFAREFFSVNRESRLFKNIG